MFEVGSKVLLRYDDSQDNQVIIKKVSVIVEAPNMQSPFWMTVEYEGNQYVVRGADCTPVK